MKIGDGSEQAGATGAAEPFDPTVRIGELMKAHEVKKEEEASLVPEGAEIAGVTPRPAAEEIREEGGEPESAAGGLAIPRDVVLPGGKPKGKEKAGEVPETTETAETTVPEPPEVKRGDQKAVAGWTVLKRENKDLHTQIKSLTTKTREIQLALETAQTELQAAKTAGGSAPELVDLRKKLEEAETRLGQYDLTQTRAFKEKYDQPFMRTMQKTRSLLQRAGIGEEQANKILSTISSPEAPLTTIQEAIEDLPMAVQGLLMTASQDLTETLSARGQAMAEWQQTQAALAEESARSGAATVGAEASRAVMKAVEGLPTESSWLFADSEDADWMKQRSSIVNAATHILKTGGPDDLAKYVLEGVAARVYRTWGENEHARANALAAEFQKRFGKVPRLGGGGGVSAAVEIEEAAEAATREADEAARRPVSGEAWLQQKLAKKK